MITYASVQTNSMFPHPPPVLMHSLYVWDGITYIMLLISVIHGHGTVVLVMWFW